MHTQVDPAVANKNGPEYNPDRKIPVPDDQGSVTSYCEYIGCMRRDKAILATAMVIYQVNKVGYIGIMAGPQPLKYIFKKMNRGQVAECNQQNHQENYQYAFPSEPIN